MMKKILAGFVFLASTSAFSQVSGNNALICTGKTQDSQNIVLYVQRDADEEDLTKAYRLSLTVDKGEEKVKFGKFVRNLKLSAYKADGLELLIYHTQSANLPVNVKDGVVRELVGGDAWLTTIVRCTLIRIYK